MAKSDMTEEESMAKRQRYTRVGLSIFFLLLVIGLFYTILYLMYISNADYQSLSSAISYGAPECASYSFDTDRNVEITLGDGVTAMSASEYGVINYKKSTGDKIEYLRISTTSPSDLGLTLGAGETLTYRIGFTDSKSTTVPTTRNYVAAEVVYKDTGLHDLKIIDSEGGSTVILTNSTKPINNYPLYFFRKTNQLNTHEPSGVTVDDDNMYMFYQVNSTATAPQAKFTLHVNHLIGPNSHSTLTERQKKLVRNWYCGYTYDIEEE